MFKQFIDLSIPLENNAFSDPTMMLPKISYLDHKESVPQMIHFFPGLSKKDLPDGEGWATEQAVLSTHNGTHLDAPYHYATTMDKGKPAITIDEIPLEWCCKPGVKLDFTRFDDSYIVTAPDIEEELSKLLFSWE